MKKFLWAAVLALPSLALGQGAARAEGGCLNLQGCFRVKICGTGFLKAWCEPFGPCCAPCGTGGCGAGGCGYGGGAVASYDACHGVVPGPWYTYWPYGGQPYMTSPVQTPGWVYDMNFQTPAPYPNPYLGFGAVAANPAAAAYNVGFQPVGYYPSYWYGR